MKEVQQLNKPPKINEVNKNKCQKKKIDQITKKYKWSSWTKRKQVQMKI